jgi:hypothetical protein
MVKRSSWINNTCSVEKSNRSKIMKPQRNLRYVLTFALLSVCTVPSIYGSTGVFGYGLEIQGTGAGAVNSGITTLYALDNNGGSRLLPLGSSAILDTTSWLNSPENAPTFSLGTFNPSAGDTLILLGGAMLTWQGTGESVGPSVWENIRLGGPGGTILPGIPLGLNENNVAGNTGDTRWANESQTINLLSGLAPGTYTLGSWGYASSSSGDLYDSNGVANFGAFFTVVPEPTSVALFGILGGLLLISKRRR